MRRHLFIVPGLCCWLASAVIGQDADPATGPGKIDPNVPTIEISFVADEPSKEVDEKTQPNLALAAQLESKPASIDPAKGMKIFSLQHADAVECINLFKELGINPPMVADPRTNSLIVMGASEQELQTVEALVLRLDEMPTRSSLENGKMLGGGFPRRGGPAGAGVPQSGVAVERGTTFKAEEVGTPLEASVKSGLATIVGENSKRTIEIRLNRISATECAAILTQIDGDSQIVAVPVSNTILISSSGKQLGKLQSIIHQLEALKSAGPSTNGVRGPAPAENRIAFETTTVTGGHVAAADRKSIKYTGLGLAQTSDSPEMISLRVELARTEAAAAELAEQIRTRMRKWPESPSGSPASESKAATAAEMDSLKSSLTTVLNNALKLKIKLEHMHLVALEERLKLLKSRIAQREAQSDKIVERRLQELIDSETLDWTPANTDDPVQEDLTHNGQSKENVGVRLSGPAFLGRPTLAQPAVPAAAKSIPKTKTLFTREPGMQPTAADDQKSSEKKDAPQTLDECIARIISANHVLEIGEAIKSLEEIQYSFRMTEDDHVKVATAVLTVNSRVGTEANPAQNSAKVAALLRDLWNRIPASARLKAIIQALHGSDQKLQLASVRQIGRLHDYASEPNFPELGAELIKNIQSDNSELQYLSVGLLMKTLPYTSLNATQFQSAERLDFLQRLKDGIPREELFKQLSAGLDQADLPSVLRLTTQIAYSADDLGNEELITKAVDVLLQVLQGKFRGTQTSSRQRATAAKALGMFKSRGAVIVPVFIELLKQDSSEYVFDPANPFPDDFSKSLVVSGLERFGAMSKEVLPLLHDELILIKAKAKEVRSGNITAQRQLLEETAKRLETAIQNISEPTPERKSSPGVGF